MNQINRDAVSGPPTTSLRRALRLLGDPWTMLILKEAFNGERRFSGFQKQLNIPKQTLSLRLTHLCHEQMMYRRQVSPTHTTLEYALTTKAFDLQQAMYSIWLWHEANPSDVSVLPFEIVHRNCGQPISARYCCMHCRDEITSGGVTVEHTHPLQFDPRDRLARRNDAAVTAAGDGGADKMVAASLVGDIVCNEILYMLFQSPAHLRAIADGLDLGMSVARGRLEKLRLLGLVEERREGRKLTYRVLPKAEKIYPLLLSISDWGDRWCNGGQPPPEVRVHTCGELVHGRFRCDHCGGWISRENVYVRPRQGNGEGEGNS